MDVEVATEALLRGRCYDSIVIGSGDADFAPVVRNLRQQQKDVWVLGTGRSVSADLLSAAGPQRFIDLAKHSAAVGRQIVDGPRRSIPITTLATPIGRELCGQPSSGQNVLLIDCPNLDNNCAPEGWSADYFKLSAVAAKHYGTPINQVVLFDRESSSRSGFLSRAKLAYGWKPVTKKPKLEECSLAVEITTAAIDAAAQGHGVIIGSSSGHLVPLVRRLHDNGVRVGLMAPETYLSGLLRKQFNEDEFFSMSNHKLDLARDRSSPFAKRPKHADPDGRALGGLQK